MALKSAQIVDFCGKSSGLADFENTVDGGSAVILDAISRLCLSYVRILGPKRNLYHRSTALVEMLMSSSKSDFFFRKMFI